MPLGENGRAEHRAVQDLADGTVGALPHLFEFIFFHALRVGRDGGALDADPVLFIGIRRVHGHFVVGRVAHFQSQIVIFRL